MNRDRLVIAQVNTSADGGGAEATARTLLHGLRELGHETSLLVGRGEATTPHVHAFPSEIGTRLAHVLAGPGRMADRWRGLETYRYPATRRMLDLLPRTPDLVHLHNLHGGYFDLRVLPELSRALPVALTLHDAWLLSGHCAHSIGCERWRTGCGSCPDLDIYPAVRRDATARNWARKQDIFRHSRLYVAAPSAWLARKVSESILEPAVQDLQVIPNGIDLAVFRPGDRSRARRDADLPEDVPVLLFVAGRTADNPFKDREMAEGAAARAAEALGSDLMLVVLGGTGPDRRVGSLTIRTAPFEPQPEGVAAWYRAADIHLHAARADTFPSTVLEAMACGTPTVATAVGGVPEQIRSLPIPGAIRSEGARPSNPTGVLVGPGDAEAMADAVVHLLTHPRACATLGRNAARDAVTRFDAAVQVQAYETWFRKILVGHGDTRAGQNSSW